MFLRAKIFGFWYRHLIKKLFFLFDPETVHDWVGKIGFLAGQSKILTALTKQSFSYTHPALEQTLLGIRFNNPIGLAAGFDKDAKLTQILPSVGFGFEEVGSLTALPYQGNQPPRLWRLPEQQTLRVNYGLKNFGAPAIYQFLKPLTFTFPVGISLAKTNSPTTSNVANGIRDYLTSYHIFHDLGHYITINISCPNTCEEKPIFAEPENLTLLLTEIFKLPKPKPVFIKLSPDLPEAQLTQILTVCATYPVDGFVCANLTKNNVFNHVGKGGFSGKAVEALTNRLIATVYNFYHGKKLIIGCGGVFNALDAYKKIKLGASLIQLITGMIYQGPQLIGEINYDLVKLLKQDNYHHIQEAVGAESKNFI